MTTTIRFGLLAAITALVAIGCVDPLERTEAGHQQNPSEDPAPQCSSDEDCPDTHREDCPWTTSATTCNYSSCELNEYDGARYCKAMKAVCWRGCNNDPDAICCSYPGSYSTSSCACSYGTLWCPSTVGGWYKAGSC